jgi:nucleoside-diphosphate-sugar epimerase
MHDLSGPEVYAEYRRVNLDGTMALARQAAQSGVRRFVFLSSIKVNGEETVRGQPFSASQRPAPADPYGVSKMEAERALLALAAETHMEVVIIRPPLVYGPGVKANFLAMMRALQKRVPLPLGAIDNRRSLVALDNLVDLIIKCIDHPAAANEIFLVSDGDDMSTTDLLRRLATAMGVSAFLIPVPEALLQFVAGLLGKGSVAKRLCGSLEIDIAKTRDLLDWHPVVSVDEALRKTVSHWLREL